MYEKVQVARDVALGFAEGFAKGVRCYVEGLSVPRRRVRRTFASCVPGFVEGLCVRFAEGVFCFAEAVLQGLWTSWIACVTVAVLFYYYQRDPWHPFNPLRRRSRGLRQRLGSAFAMGFVFGFLQGVRECMVLPLK